MLRDVFTTVNLPRQKYFSFVKRTKLLKLVDTFITINFKLFLLYILFVVFQNKK